MLDQWQLFLTTMEQILLKLIWLDIAKQCQVHGKVVRWRRVEAYGVDSDELQKYAEDLAADLKEAEGESLVLAGYFDKGSPLQSDKTRTGFRTVLCGKDLEEDGECLEEHYDSPTESEGNECREDENEDSNEYDTDDEGEDRDDGETGLDDGTDDGDSEGSCNDEEDDL